MRTLGLDYVVITSVNRDDLRSGGAEIFAACIRAIRHDDPAVRVEVLIPDFKGNWDALATVVEARPFVLNHNIETVPRLYRRVRPQAIYERSLELIRRAKELAPDMLTKSGFMVGLGETQDELFQIMRDLREHGCDIVTIGQYLRPRPQHLPIDRYYDPAEYQAFRDYGRDARLPPRRSRAARPLHLPRPRRQRDGTGTQRTTCAIRQTRSSRSEQVHRA